MLSSQLFDYLKASPTGVPAIMCLTKEGAEVGTGAGEGAKVEVGAGEGACLAQKPVA